MKKFAVIVAGGSGSRMNSNIPKQFLLIKNRPLLFYTIDVFLKAYDDLEIILVLPEEHIGKGQEIIDAYFDTSRISICPGGRTRFHSVQNGLSLINVDSIIFVHDGVRCLVTKDLIERCYNKAKKWGSAIPVITSKDSVRLLTAEGHIALDRNTVKLVQTPQTFHSKVLLNAFKIDYKEKFTDEASVVEAFGIKVNLIEGEENNIKITTPGDMFIAEQIIKGISSI
ncbi:MAG: 2-C-methyl-D-erythritol 4-phosphate cytidylyltransferase [Chitinophagaceae bacterium]|nr:2-C-methyl-D-erythritol 4-phosphate cytidylyltransferase [Chitinophagaceae bacterium]MDB5221583.1 2-C-methyl-D-erythritol 4-phosphate cytidylyltransferase [Chitinophagaceae bacterium]